MKPFLKWAGNKYKIVDRIKKVLPPGHRLVEPFVGSGAVFLNTDYSEYLLCDINKDLINLYKTIQKEGIDFIEYCKAFFTPANNTETRYYELRDQFNSIKDIRKKSAIFVYLNKHGFNGLCRYNSSGAFNVPFGSYTKPYFPEKEMKYFYEKSQNAVFKCADFQKTMSRLKQGDVVYCDPPYVPLSATSNFTNYSAGGFGLLEQKKLAELAEKLTKKGVPVLISNHDTEFTNLAYASAKTITRFKVQRYISCDGTNRNKAGEMLALFCEGV